RPETGHWLPDNARLELHLEEYATGDRVHCFEPAIEGAVEDQISRSGKHAAPDRKALFDPPSLVARRGVPGHQLSPVAARAGFHNDARADERRSLNVIHFQPFIIHANVIR